MVQGKRSETVSRLSLGGKKARISCGSERDNFREFSAQSQRLDNFKNAPTFLHDEKMNIKQPPTICTSPVKTDNRKKHPLMVE